MPYRMLTTDVSELNGIDLDNLSIVGVSMHGCVYVCLSLSLCVCVC